MYSTVYSYCMESTHVITDKKHDVQQRFSEWLKLVMDVSTRLHMVQLNYNGFSHHVSMFKCLYVFQMATLEGWSKNCCYSLLLRVVTSNVLDRHYRSWFEARSCCLCSAPCFPFGARTFGIKSVGCCSWSWNKVNRAGIHNIVTTISQRPHSQHFQNDHQQTYEKTTKTG